MVDYIIDTTPEEQREAWREMFKALMTYPYRGTYSYDYREGVELNDREQGR
jgi:hypothetical protein